MRYDIAMIHFNILIILGLCIAVMPHLGFPQEWNTIFLTAAGCLVTGFSYYLSRVFVEDEIDEQKDTQVLPE